MVVVKAGNVVTITLTANENTVINWAIANFGPDVVKRYLDDYILNRAQAMRETIKEKRQAAYDAATPAQKAQIDAILGVIA